MKKRELIILSGVMIALFGLMAGTASGQLNEGLVELWELNNDYSAKVIAEHVGTLMTTGTGSGTFVGGKFGQGIKLDNSSGNQAYIVIGGDENDFDFAAGSMSISLWYTTESLYTSWQALAAKGEGDGWRLHRSSGSGTDINWQANKGITGNGALDQQDGSWHHVVATVDAAGGNTLYIDGVKVGTVEGPVNIADKGNAMQIGGNPDAGGRGWDGKIDDVAVWNRALSEEEVAMIWNGGAGASIGAIISSGPEIVFPTYGEVVDPYPASVTLEWINLDPNGADDVYVDVWFGTEPVYDPNNPGGFEKVVSGQAVSSYTVTPPGPGIYYWQVDSYLNGDPAVVADPCAVKGSVYMFTNDGAAIIESMGPDMITWSGEPVVLVADVNDDGGSELTYLWTADTPADVIVDFDYSSGQATPTITATKDFGVLTIVNSGFEDPVLVDGGYTWNNTPGWSGSGVGVWNPGDPNGSGAYKAYGGDAPEGENIVFVNGGQTLSQVLTSTLAADSTYTLSVQIGKNAGYASSTYKVELLAGDAVLAEDDNGISAETEQFYLSEIAYDSSTAEPNWIGLPLQIRLSCTGPDGGEFNFDDVRLNVSPDRPVSEAVSTVTVTVAVQDETNPAVKDSMTIDVYDTACMATRVGLGEAVNHPADFNLDCKVNIKDIAMMAAKWLNDTAATMTTVDK